MNKKISYWILWLLIPLCSIAQTFHSWEGYTLSPNAKFMTLNLMVNIIYDVNPDKDQCVDMGYWPKAHRPGVNNEAIPSYLLDFLDTVYNAQHLHGTMTRLYGESSFDSLQITGDFIVINLPESYILEHGRFEHINIGKSTIKFINEHGGLRTLYGHDDLRFYDYLNNHTIYFTQILIRNITATYGGANIGSGWGGCFLSKTDSILIGDAYYYFNDNGTTQCVGSDNFAINPTSIVSHEFSHALFGNNDFHTSGGNHRGGGCAMTFLNIQGGYGLMGAAGASLVGCNGYERWRLHWKDPNAIDYIAARDEHNTHSVPSDISMADGEQTFLLRDFITYGDAIRILLPYKDSTSSSNQYIWLENHQVGFNDKLEFLQYSNTFECRPQGKAGIYAYYQVGRDQLSGTQREVWDMHDRDNLRIIPAEGYYDFVMAPDTYNLACVAYGQCTYTIFRSNANPFCGNQDQQRQFFPAEGSTLLRTSDEYAMWRKTIGGYEFNTLSSLGDEEDAFTKATKLNMGTNPSTCNAITCHSKNIGSKICANLSRYDTRTTYLSGLGIEMTPLPNHDFLVRIRWNDYNIINDMRWTGNIVLLDTANLTKGHVLILCQNYSIIQPTLNETTGLFSPPTTFNCHSNALLHLEENSGLQLTENSTLVLDSASHLVLEDGSSIKLKNGSTLYIKSGADVQLFGNAQISGNANCIIILEDESSYLNWRIKRKHGQIRSIQR